MTSAFEVLGLLPGSEVSDDDVRAAWRRIAAATHPDRPDGGDPAAFAAAAAAYTLLRTPAGRAEAMADLRPPDHGGGPGRPVPVRQEPLVAPAARLGWRIRHGRPARLAARLLAAGAAGVLAVAGVGWQPASAGVITGALTWLLLTGRHDLAARPR